LCLARESRRGFIDRAYSYNAPLTASFKRRYINSHISHILIDYLFLLFRAKVIMPASVRRGNKRCFCPSVRSSVCLSLRPSRTYRIIREPKGLACPYLEGRFPTLDATRIPVSRSNGQRSGLEADRGVQCRPNPAATLLVISES